MSTAPSPLAGGPRILRVPVEISTSSVTTLQVWTHWNNQYVISTEGLIYAQAVCSQTATSSVWYHWNEIYCTSSGRPEDRAAVVERERRQVEIADRAEAALLAHLTPEQAAQYARDRHFEVVSRQGGKVRRYRIHHGWAGNILVLDEKNREIERLCIHPTRQVPYADNLLAQKLLLEADEDQFRRIANITRLAA